jgi:hypothetical protein
MNKYNYPEITRQEAVEVSKKLQEIFDKQYAYLKYKALEMGINEIVLTNWGNHYLVNITYYPSDHRSGLAEKCATKVMEFFK